MGELRSAAAVFQYYSKDSSFASLPNQYAIKIHCAKLTFTLFLVSLLRIFLLTST